MSTTQPAAHTTTKARIYDLLFNRPLTKAALFAYLELQKGPPQWVELMRPRAEAIAERFGIKPLVLDWKNAA